MNRAFKRTLQVTLAAAVVAGLNVGLLSTSASAAGNTWIRGSKSGRCLEANNNADKVWAAPCDWGKGAQLWSRVGSQIKRAYTNQCLDSDFNGDVYWMECNGGDYQKWEYRDAGNGYFLVSSWITGKALQYRPIQGADDVYTQASLDESADYAWRFADGE
ncbi:ricin-type beta-trefoil lectin domain protein [Streptomyces sp. AC550_RSS872]|uniref:RICIN domain-containing protein n=1 Tax=Streptomyces sp. AC550_RSS872 TaxID=2823689 RepID=UPI001C2698EC|nr:ricin-type beta-trefoil lectin domain protein [Streptomyces sp. AC550_RSS872]